MLTIAQALKNSKIPLVEAEIILAFLLKKDRSYLNAYSEQKLLPQTKTLFQNFVKRRKSSEPLAYILGFKEFFGLKFIVNNSVLIPRPETEEMVMKALSFIKTKKNPLVADVGTGSGCIAIAIGKSNPNSIVLASDVSTAALNMARKNAKLNNVTNIEFRKQDLLSGSKEKFDLIVSNLPYIPTSKWRRLEKNIKTFEPRLALDSGENSMQIYNRLFKQAVGKLRKNGKLFYELDGKVIELSADDLAETARE